MSSAMSIRSESVNLNAEKKMDARYHAPLDPTLYDLRDDEAVFFKSLTGIQDDNALREHIISVQTKAYQFFPYHCIYAFNFLRLKISRLPMYKHVLEIGQTRKGALLLDIGCCFGNDVRKAVADGWPVQNAIASDLNKEFWNMGHELFKSDSTSFPVPFIHGDAFDPNFLAPGEPVMETPQTPPPLLSSLTTLTSLRGHISVLHASSFFHLFDEGRQFELAKKVATLLSPVPGSFIFGSHVGKETKGNRGDESFHRRHMFCHSPDSWKELWDGEVFPQGSVTVNANLVRTEQDSKRLSGDTGLLVWSVMRSQ